MSKKQRRKTLQKKDPIIVRGDFGIDSAKMYIVAALIMFHIIPLVFVFMGENGVILLSTMFMFTLNPIFIFAVGFFNGMRLGFTWRFPLLLTVISTASILMYYEMESAENIVMTVTICLIVYAVFSFLSCAAGAFVKRFMGGF